MLMVEIDDTDMIIDESELDIDMNIDDEEACEKPQRSNRNSTIKTKDDTINKKELIDNLLDDIARNLLFIHDKAYLPEIKERVRIISKDMRLLKKLMG